MQLSAAAPNSAMAPIVSYLLSGTPNTTPAFMQTFGIGFGGGDSFPFADANGDAVWVSAVDLVMNPDIASDGYYQSIKYFDGPAFTTLQSKLSKSKYLVLWVTEGWDESWFDTAMIQQAMTAGYIPVFSYWYFGDTLDAMPDATAQATYFEDAARLGTLLQKLNGTKLVIMEPEFNKDAIVADDQTQHEFATMIAAAIDIVKSGNTDLYMALSMMDTGSRQTSETHCVDENGAPYASCAYGDAAEWDRPGTVFTDLLALNKLDFVAFHQMIAQFSRNPFDPGTWESPNPMAFTPEELGIAHAHERIRNLTAFLHERYGKPVFMPYIGLMSGTWSDANENGAIDDGEIDPSGWDSVIDGIYEQLSLIETDLQNAGLFGYAVMELFDDPKHDYIDRLNNVKGYQYFMQNEYNLGIVRTNAVDEVDNYPTGDITFKGAVLDHLFH